jgi:hypothetical protein
VDASLYDFDLGIEYQLKIVAFNATGETESRTVTFLADRPRNPSEVTASDITHSSVRVMPRTSTATPAMRSFAREDRHALRRRSYSTSSSVTARGSAGRRALRDHLARVQHGSPLSCRAAARLLRIHPTALIRYCA